jgi:hypothetical protein
MTKPLQVWKNMFWNPMYFWDTLKGVMHVHGIFFAINITPLIV